DGFSKFLFERYITENVLETEVINDVRRDAQGLLEKLVSLLDYMAQNTTTYNNEIDKTVEDLASRLHVKELREAVTAIIEKTRLLRVKSTSMHERLEASANEVRALKRDLEKISVEAQKDFLTGVENRKSFDARLDQCIAQA